ncbi:MAG: glycosyltransferase, partial [Candidatus Kapabacteria bacterium]|nr:glycosyltransferase [Candidatus Kapabacteria bacterium]MDW7996583.1 glycosyltransferase [Bacteroidota bacterium]
MLPVAVVILARDSADTIERAINSVQSVASQIVVLDTGSCDDTPSRCAQLGAEVYFAPWEGDFAAARNQALRYVRMPWVLALDSDEELEADTFLAQAYLLEQPQLGGVEVQIRSVASVQKREPLVQTHWYPRIFRRAEGVAYVGRVHEQIRPAIEAQGWDIVRAPILIW